MDRITAVVRIVCISCRIIALWPEALLRMLSSPEFPITCQYAAVAAYLVLQGTAGVAPEQRNSSDWLHWKSFTRCAPRGKYSSGYPQKNFFLPAPYQHDQQPALACDLFVANFWEKSCVAPRTFFFRPLWFTAGIPTPATVHTNSCTYTRHCTPV